MKIFKIFILFIFLSLSVLSAQNRSVASVPVHVSLVKGLSLNIMKSNLDFGEILLSPTETLIKKPATEGIVFEISGNPNKNVSINYSVTSLSNSTWSQNFGGTKGNISFIPDVFVSANQSELQKIENGSVVNLDKSNDGKILVNIGGDLRLAVNQPAGDYTGNIYLTVSY
jgi:hypothetical protein